uniref:60S large subunit ribosomal protein P2 n=1 Tax=Euglena gracilis TaxID=3039 RepID=A0A7L5NVS3_EUGGR|nr:60S large subunit ribosomal protein P2 [Euglena gracilis]
MKHIAAYLLVALSGATPSKEKVIEVLKAGECEADEERLDSLISALEGKDINEVIAEGLSKIGSVSLGGGGGAAAPAAAAPAAAAAEAAPAKKEEKKEEEEEDEDMGFGLFD